MTAKEERQLLERHVSYARGWIALSNVEEAALELEEVPPSLKLDPLLLSCRCELYFVAQQWDLLAATAKHLVGVEPLEPWHWLNWAYGVRRSDSIAAAERILLRAQEEFPNSATIHFNLACYAAQQGRISEVAALLHKATSLDTKYQQRSLDDPDLEPYWASLKSGGPVNL